MRELFDRIALLLRDQFRKENIELSITCPDSIFTIPMDDRIIEQVLINLIKNGGDGIGLSFSQHVMCMHNGQLKVNTSPGLGSEFHLVFPVT